MFIACIYIPPVNSIYAERESFYNVENEYIRFNDISQNIIVLGDWNGHISDRVEIILNKGLDENENEFLDTLSAATVLSQLNIPVRRLSCDKSRVDAWGKSLIDFCKTTGAIIVNGRFGPLSSNNTTIFNTTVDYVLCSSDMLKDIISMQVNDFNPLLSDVHCAIETSIKITPNNIFENTDTLEIPPTTAKQQENRPILKPNKWESDKKDSFLLHIDSKLLQEIHALTENSNDIKENQQDQVDSISNKISLLFSQAALATFGKKRDCLSIGKKIAKNNNFENHKPWYTSSCKYKRNIFNKARRKYNRTKSNVDFLAMKQRGKEYKREVKAAVKSHNNNIRSEIRELRKKSNVKAYWDYCRADEKNDTKNCIDFPKFVDFFKKTNDDNDTSKSAMNEKSVTVHQPENYLDTDITAKEITDAVRNLKNNKASGIDGITNEYIKASIHLLLPVYVKIFNIIYDQSTVPSSWTTGIIKPIYKQKGNKQEPDNYRPITILSCLGKLFTAVLNARLKVYTETENFIGEDQIGFRENYSTIDGIFSLYSLIDLMKKRRKKLFCAFIDLKKCFGSIWREGLWDKVNNMQLGRKMTNTLMSIYKNVKSCVKMYSHDSTGQLIFNSSELFDCMNGLREGENLSPILFSIYVNDLKLFLEEHNCQGVNIQCINGNQLDENIMYFFKMFILMYADDTVLFANTNQELQYTIDAYAEYCKLWKLNVNITKTKIMYFGKKGSYEFYMNNENVEIVDNFKYLGVVFSRNGKFSDAMIDNIEKARKGLFRLRRTFREKKIPVDCQVELFEKIIEPTLLYGCELWGMENTECIEQFRLKSYKQILQVRNSTPSYIVYGELGKLPLKCSIKIRMIKFWSRIIMGKVEKTSYQLLNIMLKDDCNYKWINYVRNILDETGNTYIWVNQQLDKRTENYIAQNLKDQELQTIRAKANMSTKGNTYIFLKVGWELEHYLASLDVDKTRALIKFRTGNHRLPIETGRYKKIPIEKRKCRFCNTVGDEFHYVLECQHFISAGKNI